jgi:ribosome-associated protein
LGSKNFSKTAVTETMRFQAGQETTSMIPGSPIELGRKPGVESKKSALAIAHWGLDKKAEQVCIIDVRTLSSYADYLVIMTADSEPQMKAIVEHVEEKMKETGERPLGVEGVDAGQWLLIDYGDVVAHVFDQETRDLYGLESLWVDAPRVPVEQ